VTRRRERRRKKLLDDLKDRRGYSHLTEEALDRTIYIYRERERESERERQTDNRTACYILCLPHPP
jgi:hypothetical protein